MSEKAHLNPFYVREYKASIDNGSACVCISAPGGQLPVGEDADELIAFFQLIIRQIERSRDRHEGQIMPITEPVESA